MEQYQNVLNIWQSYQIKTSADLDKYLMINNHPPIIVYDEDKNEYYANLQEYDESEEISPLYKFLRQQCVKTWAKAMKLGENPPRKGLKDFIETGQTT